MSRSERQKREIRPHELLGAASWPLSGERNAGIILYAAGPLSQALGPAPVPFARKPEPS